MVRKYLHTYSHYKYTCSLCIVALSSSYESLGSKATGSCSTTGEIGIVRNKCISIYIHYATVPPTYLFLQYFNIMCIMWIHKINWVYIFIVRENVISEQSAFFPFCRIFSLYPRKISCRRCRRSACCAFARPVHWRPAASFYLTVHSKYAHVPRRIYTHV